MVVKYTALVALCLSIVGLFASPASVFADDPTPTPSADCTNEIPKEAPNLYQIVAVKDKATLYFSPPSGTYDGFTISYGLTTSADSYNTTFQQSTSTGAISHEVNSLSPNSKYYFKVRANNGCATGPWSSVVSASNATKPPVTGPLDGTLLAVVGGLLLAGGLGIFVRFR